MSHLPIEHNYFKVFWLFRIIDYMRINFQLSGIWAVMKVNYWVNYKSAEVCCKVCIDNIWFSAAKDLLENKKKISAT